MKEEPVRLRTALDAVASLTARFPLGPCNCFLFESGMIWLLRDYVCLCVWGRGASARHWNHHHIKSRARQGRRNQRSVPHGEWLRCRARPAGERGQEGELITHNVGEEDLPPSTPWKTPSQKCLYIYMCRQKKKNSEWRPTWAFVSLLF